MYIYCDVRQGIVYTESVLTYSFIYEACLCYKRTGTCSLHKNTQLCEIYMIDYVLNIRSTTVFLISNICVKRNDLESVITTMLAHILPDTYRRFAETRATDQTYI